MKYATKRQRRNNYEDRQKIWLLRYGRKDMAQEGQSRIVLMLKQLSALFKLICRITTEQLQLCEGSFNDSPKASH